MKRYLQFILSLFSGVQVLLYLAITWGVSTVYLYVLTRNLLISGAFSLLTAFVMFQFVILQNKKVAREQFLLKELQKYATNMTFYLQSGYNVLKALESSKNGVDPQIQRDIDITIDTLRKEAVLSTEHFKKYRFSSIDIFHRILEIKYKKGGNTKELFTNVNKSINFEIVKRDELYRKKKYMLNKIIVMILLVLAIPLIISLMAKEVYTTFLSYGIAPILLILGLCTAMLISYAFLQRAVSDLSLQS